MEKFILAYTHHRSIFRPFKGKNLRLLLILGVKHDFDIYFKLRPKEKFSIFPNTRPLGRLSSSEYRIFLKCVLGA